jgi:hypothetical protein
VEALNMSVKVNKVICACCGAVNEVQNVEIPNMVNWLPCSLPTGFEWSLPSGKITPVVGEPIYKDANGASFSYKEYLTKYNIDPEIAYTKMRAYGSPHDDLKEKSKGVHVEKERDHHTPLKLGHH